MPKAKKPRQSSKPVGTFKRDTPDLPSDFEIAEDPSKVFADKDEVLLQDLHLHEIGNSVLSINSFRLSGCLFEQVVLSNSTFGSVVWKDVRLVGCDLANIRAHRLVLTRVELIDCRMTGLSATGIQWNDVLVQDSDLRYAQLPGGAFSSCEFQRCDWSEADLHEADLSGCLLRACNLSRADLNRSRLHNADLRASDIESLQIGTNDVRGAIVDPTQAMVLARLLGVQIR